MHGVSGQADNWERWRLDSANPYSVEAVEGSQSGQSIGRRTAYNSIGTERSGYGKLIHDGKDLKNSPCRIKLDLWKICTPFKAM